VQVQRPGDMFDREEEWDALVRFATSPSAHALLGIVSGRRRQGKSYLLQALCEQADGVYLSAAELTAREALLALGAALGASRRLPPLLLPDWPAALDALLALSGDRPLPVVIDEFPYLAKAVPELASHLQTALGPRRPQRRDSRVRLVVCGSALSFMGRLLSGTAPLRGRASLDMVVRPFDYRAAAWFWGLDDPALALRVHAIVGGTPAYRREFVDDDAPASMDDFDPWVTRTVLNPRSPLFREARYLLAEETDLRDTTGYHALLAAATAGNATRARIGSALGRSGTEISHQLTVLEDAGLLVRREDAFRQQRPTYAVAEPLLAFYEAVMRPQWPRLERGHGPAVWVESRPRFAAQVLGPHFESLCREWTAYHAAPETLGGVPARVDAGVVSDPAGRATHEVDVVALDAGGGVLALGEAKLGEVMGVGHLDRLRRVRELLGRRAEGARLLCFSGAGFAADLRAEARRGNVELVDLDRLYGGA
jgi:AAA+ ATPase superfamily predicted ATPase